MNIFVLDKDPVKAAEYHCNKHVVKMILEAGQMLCAAHWLHLFKNYYKGEITDFKRVKDLKEWLTDDKNTHPLERPWSGMHVCHLIFWSAESCNRHAILYQRRA